LFLQEQIKDIIIIIEYQQTTSSLFVLVLAETTTTVTTTARWDDLKDDNQHMISRFLREVEHARGQAVESLAAL